MAFDQHNRGDPFHKVRPGGPADSPPDYVRAAVRRQVIELTQRPYKPAVRHTLLRSLQRRRQRWPSVLDASLERLPFGFTDHTVTQFDFLPVNVGADTLWVRGSWPTWERFSVLRGFPRRSPTSRRPRGCKSPRLRPRLRLRRAALLRAWPRFLRRCPGVSRQRWRSSTPASPLRSARTACSPTSRVRAATSTLSTSSHTGAYEKGTAISTSTPGTARSSPGSWSMSRRRRTSPSTVPSTATASPARCGWHAR